MDEIPALEAGRTALLVMDYQPGIVALLEDPDALLAKAGEALAAARAAGATVGYVRVAFTPEDVAAMPATSRMGQNLRARGTALSAEDPATQIHPAVAPVAGDIVVRKTRVGPFGTTDLHEQLAARGVDTLVLAGISTSGVVLSTVRDGSDRDFRILVLADATADPDPEVHAFLLERILPRQAEMISVSDFATALSSR
jgi:nicotinamidase-related amidase